MAAGRMLSSLVAGLAITLRQQWSRGITLLRQYYAGALAGPFQREASRVCIPYLIQFPCLSTEILKCRFAALQIC